MVLNSLFFSWLAAGSTTSRVVLDNSGEPCAIPAFLKVPLVSQYRV